MKLTLKRLIIGHGALWVGLTIGGNLLDDWIPDPFWHHVWLIFGVAWLWLAVAALIHIVWEDKARLWQRLQPLALTITVACLLSGAMALRLADRLEWSVKRRGFARAVKMVERGQLKPDREASIVLPENLRWLSRIKNVYSGDFDGKIIARRHGEKWSIFFATQNSFNGVQGYAYCAGAERPVGLGAENVRVAFRPASGWFYCELLERGD